MVNVRVRGWGMYYVTIIEVQMCVYAYLYVCHAVEGHIGRG